MWTLYIGLCVCGYVFMCKMCVFYCVSMYEAMSVALLCP